MASAPVSSGALRSCVITAAAPNAAAERRMAPTLRGSVTWSSTRTGPGRLQRCGRATGGAAGRPAGRRPDAPTSPAEQADRAAPAPPAPARCRQGCGRRGGERRLGLLGQQQAAQPARRIGQRRGDRVQPVQPQRRRRRVGHGAVRGRFGAAAGRCGGRRPCSLGGAYVPLARMRSVPLRGALGRCRPRRGPWRYAAACCALAT